ncbi:hypothetical protein GQ53DRAFT_766753 [Thozetella sp. PMI_491]|nr:hypothetical protein GQ53DRAFT_766753 [Thozetella sp. PMI_491]
MASRMKLVISELCYSRPKSLFVQDYTPPSIIKKFQMKLEALSGEEWDWWPLQPPKGPLNFGELRIGWICTCGFIFLVANFRRHTMDEIASLSLNTTGFSIELRSAYLRLKGFWSSLFSLYGFSHCEFGRASVAEMA